MRTTTAGAALLGGLLSTFAGAGCDGPDGRPAPPLQLGDDAHILATSADARRASIQLPDNRTVTVLYEPDGDEAIYNGDIVLGDADVLDSGFRAAAVTGRLWPNARVRWFDGGLSPIKRAAAEAAMAQWEAATTIEFVEIAEGDRGTLGHVVVTEEGTVCKSGWGYPGPGSSYKLRMGTYCTLDATWLHEFGHAIGLLHEHARSDRSDHIEILWDNVKDNTVPFDKYEDRGIAGADLGPYDFASIMHYDSTTYSPDGKAYTMVRRDGSVIEPNFSISAGDKAAVNSMYASPPDEPTLVAGSCTERCNATDLIDAGDGRQCSCHPTCHTWKDCCDDFVAACEGGTDKDDDAADSPADNVCEGKCDSDQSQTGGCYCDALCVENGDCCDGRAAACGDGSDPGADSGSNPALPDDPPASCQDRCGEYSPSAPCQCDDQCSETMDCCEDRADICGSDSTPPSPSGASCADVCGAASSPDGSCFCDEGCEEFGDCCDDYAVACG